MKNEKFATAQSTARRSHCIWNEDAANCTNWLRKQFVKFVGSLRPFVNFSIIRMAIRSIREIRGFKRVGGKLNF
jgi:hypothetical protein